MGTWNHKEKAYVELTEGLGLELKSLASLPIISIITFHSAASTAWSLRGKHICSSVHLHAPLESACYVSGAVPSTWGKCEDFLLYKHVFLVTLIH